MGPRRPATSRSRRQRGGTKLRVLGVLVVLGAAAAALTPWALERGSRRVADEVAARLAEALGGTCRVSGARVLSSREVELTGVGCVLDQGPLLGFGAGRVQARFAGTPLGGPLPAAESVVVGGLQVRLRDPPSFAQVSARQEPGGDSAPAEEGPDWSIRIEQEALRFLAFSQALSEGRGGDRVPTMLRRLSPDGELRIDGAGFDLPDGSPLAREVHVQVERRDDALVVTLAAAMPDGGVAGFDGALSTEGLQDARIRLEAVDVAPILARLGGDEAQVSSGAADGTFAWKSDGKAGAWTADVALSGVVLSHPGLGRDPIPLPSVRFGGRLLPDEAGGRLSLDEGSWRVEAVRGDLDLQLGPLGQDEVAMLQLHAGGQELRLGELLAALPEALLPRAWAEEIQGVMDVDLRFEGTLHDRSTWNLDWSGDFSRMFLASGELARQVEALRGPFPHTFPARGEAAPVVRTIGPEGEAFVALDQVSAHLVNAVVSTEDSGFFAHSGFEVGELREAVLENLREGGGRGGSTITQQLAKNLFLSGERTFARKLKEAVISWRLESDLPKERILEIYLNIAEWGPGLYGIHEAADHYFSRRPSVLRPEEAAFLASLLPAPRRYHRYYHSGRGLTANRHERVQDILRSMNRMGRLKARDYHLARGLPIELAHCTLPTEER